MRTRWLLPALLLLSVSALTWVLLQSGGVGSTGPPSAIPKAARPRAGPVDGTIETRPTPRGADAAVTLTRRVLPTPQAAQDTGAEASQPSGGALEILAIDNGTDAPLSGFTLRVRAETQAVPAQLLTTDERGAVRSEAIFERGLLAIEHVPDPSSSGFAQPWRVLETSAIIDFDQSDVAVLEVRADAPRLSLGFEVVRESGRPAAGAEVIVFEGQETVDGRIWWRGLSCALADDSGLATFLLYDADFSERLFAACLREPLEGEVSDVLQLPRPVDPGPWSLRLYRGSRLLVRVLAGDRKPDADLEVVVRNTDGVRPRRLQRAKIDAAGEAHFVDLPAGPHQVGVYVSGGQREPLSTVHCELGRDSDHELVVQVDGDLLAPIVVSGWLFEPDGSPADDGMLRVSCEGFDSDFVFTDGDGFFEYRSHADCQTVVVSAAASVFSEPIAPEHVRVPAGTTGLVFRKTTTTEEAFVLFEIVDAHTLRPIDNDLDPSVTVYREPPEGRRITAFAFFGPDAGSTVVDFHPHPDLRWVVSAPGYQEERGILAAPESGAETPIYRVELHRGFRRPVVVRDSRTGHRVPGVVISNAEGRTLGRTGSDGGALLTAASWPGILSFEREGYQARSWNADAHWSNFSHQVWMERATP